MKNILLLVTFFVCLYSCVNQKQSEELKEFQINGEQAFSDNQFNMPHSIYSIADFLVVRNNSRAEPFFETYSIRNERIVNSFGKKGKAPGELIFPGSIFFSQEHKKLFIHAMVLSQVFYLDEIDLSSSTPKLKKYCDIVRDGFFSQTACILDSSFVMQGVSRESERWKFQEISSSNVFNKGVYRQDIIQSNNEGISSFRKEISLRGKLVANEAEQRIATAFRNSDLFEIYDVIKDEIIGSSAFSKPILRNFSGEGLNDRATIDNDAILGYLDLCKANDLIYCLYSDQKIADVLESRNKSHSNEIHVFDWDAELICKIRLNIPIHCLTYNEKYNIIIGVRDSPEPEIFYFNNPKI